MAQLMLKLLPFLMITIALVVSEETTTEETTSEETTTELPEIPVQDECDVYWENKRNPCETDSGQICDPKNVNILLTCENATVNAEHCSSVDPTKPYCYENACQATPFASLEEYPAFRCTNEGQFPNPNDCRSYFFCFGAGSDSVRYICPRQYFYKSSAGMCKRQCSDSDCQTIDCSGIHVSRYQVYGADRSILAYCLPNEPQNEAILYRCPNYKTMEYDEETLRCQFICKSEGRFPYDGDSNAFYECYYNDDEKLEFMMIRCPLGYVFNGQSKLCMRAYYS